MNQGKQPLESTAEPIITTSLADEIAFRLRRKILEGEYPPGTHLVQDELCESFGVSRTPIREALRKLQAQHLVVVIPNRGAKVRGLSRKELSEVYTVRAELEGLSCELAVPNLTPEHLERLKASQSVLEVAVRQFQRGQVKASEESSFNARLNRANEEFHGEIHRAADNHHLTRMIGDLQSFFPKDYIWQANRAQRREFLDLNVKEHQEILQALLARRAKEARRAMIAHVRHAGSRLIRFLDAQGMWKS